MKYSKKLMHYFHRTQHAGNMLIDNINSFQVNRGHPQNGDRLSLMIWCEQGMITKACFKAAGSVPLIACCEFVCEWLENKKITELYLWDGEKLLKELNLTSLHIHVIQLLNNVLKDLLNQVSMDKCCDIK